MSVKKDEITCCKGKYHMLMNGKFYCMAPPNIECSQLLKDAGKFTKGDKKIFYCEHHQHPCSNCKQMPHVNSDKED